ncbi:MAG: hypothetical protein KAT43_02630 [Nanoarchaeota archaeon]|nr:hypothetical protein [Nanoarchaeota archaeon]
MIDIETLVRGVKYVAGGLLLGGSLLFGGGCDLVDEDDTVETETFAATAGNHEVQLSWKHPDNIEVPGVKIRRKIDYFPTDPTDGTLVYEGRERSYVDSGLDAKILYCYTAFSFSYADPIVYFSEKTVSATPFDATPPANVSNIVVTPQAGAIELTWTNPIDADFAGLCIWRRTSLDENSGPVVYQSTGESFTDTDVIEDNVTYYYAFYTFDEVPNHSRQIIVSGTTIDITPPNEVSNFQTTIQNNIVNISWTNPTNVDFAGVMIRKCIDLAPYNPTEGDLVYQGPEQSYADTLITQDGNYFYTIFSYDDVSNYSSGEIKLCTIDMVVAQGWFGCGQDGWRTDAGVVGGYYADKFFDQPNHVFVDINGNIFVADSMNNRICKWDSNGNAQGWIGGGSNGWKTGLAPSSGSDYQSFSWPSGVWVDSNGNIYVADHFNNRISKWDSNGNAQGWIGGGYNGWQTGSNCAYSQNYTFFYRPISVFVNNSNNVFVADLGNHRISKWDSSGNAISWIGGGSDGWKQTSGASPGTDYKSFSLPSDIFVENGMLYIADKINERISRWDSNGNAIGWIGGGSNGWKNSSGTTAGDDYQSFRCPRRVFVRNGHIYVADFQNHRICKWNLNGDAIGWIGGGSDGWKTNSGIFGGYTYQHFMAPYSVFVDTNDNIFVSEFANNRVSKWKD